MIDPANASSAPATAPATASVGHETTDVRPGIIGLFGLGLVAMVAVVLPFLGWVYWTLESTARREQRSLSSLQSEETYTGPKLQAQPAVELRKVRDESMKRLTSYGWIDQNKGVVHVPVDVAIDILATRGLLAPEGSSQEKHAVRGSPDPARATDRRSPNSAAKSQGTQEKPPQDAKP